MLVEVDPEKVDTMLEFDEEVFRHLFCLDGHSPDVPELMVIAPRLVQWVQRLHAGEEISPVIEASKPPPPEPPAPPAAFCRHNSPYVPETGRYECGEC